MNNLTLVIASCLMFTSGAATAARNFSFGFDAEQFNTPRGSLGPVVATGSFVSPIDLTSGETYALTDLPGYSFSFVFPDISFSQVDITTPVSQVAVRVDDIGGGVLRLFFTENSNPANGGPQKGSLDLGNAGGVLSFEPTAHQFSQSDRYIKIGPSGFSNGNYLATTAAVPEPASWAMLITGFGFVGVISRRRRMRAA